jgi:hypothetical protein
LDHQTRCISQEDAGFPLPLITLVTDKNKSSTGESKTPAIVTLANWIYKWRMCNFIKIRI